MASTKVLKSFHGRVPLFELLNGYSSRKGEHYVNYRLLKRKARSLKKVRSLSHTKILLKMICNIVSRIGWMSMKRIY